MQKALGQPIVIENVGGAGGMIAAAKAARAEPDDYAILLHQNALAAGMALYPNHTFDAEKDFVLKTSGTPFVGLGELRRRSLVAVLGH
jgi:tripartite-type tricarboxylate transporter receptor subunit TctC